MTTADPAQTYRRLAGQGVSLVSLLVLSYDQIIDSLHRASRAIEANEVEKKTADLNHTLELIARLQNALDFERGGDVARSLDRFYNVARSQIVEGSAQSSPQSLSQVAEQFLSLREAWEQIEKSSLPSPSPADSALHPRADPPDLSSEPTPHSDWTA